MVNNIDEVKLIKSKKLEVINSVENTELIKEKEQRTKKQNLVEIKQDFIEELKLLEDIKARQENEKRKFQQRRDA